MSIERGFLDDIIANPDDDTPRLIYADWLDDHDDSDRAEFIRLQCRLARLPEANPARPELRAREAEFLLTHGRTWAESLRGLANEVQFRRGFVEAIKIWQVDDMAGAISEAMGLCPLRALWVVPDEKQLDSIPTAGSCLGRLRELYLELCIEPDPHQLSGIFEKGWFGGLKTFFLDADGLEISPADVTELLLPGVLPRLECLGLNPEFGLIEEDEQVQRVLIEATHLSGLRSLHLILMSLDRYGMELVNCPAFSALEELNLQQCFATEANWRDLLWSPRLDGLRILNLTATRIAGTEPLRDTTLAVEVCHHFSDALVVLECDEVNPLPQWSGLTI